MTTEVLTEAPIEELMQAKAEAEEAQKIKNNLTKAVSRKAHDPFEID